MKTIITCPYYPLDRYPKTFKTIHPFKIRFVQRDIQLQPLHKTFYKMARNVKREYKKVEGGKSMNVLKLLDRVIPDEFFGRKKHRRRFYKIVKLVLTRSAHECIYLSQLTKRFNVFKIPWLRVILEQGLYGKNYCTVLLYHAHLWVLERIVKPLIKRLFAQIKKGRSYEVELVPKRLWHSFWKRIYNNLTDWGYLVPTESKNPRGVLSVRPKGDYFNTQDYRPIMMLRPEKFYSKMRTREIIRMLYKVAARSCSTKTRSLYDHWKKYVKLTEGRQIYIAKVDVKDAFGNIQVGDLQLILELKCRSGETISAAYKLVCVSDSLVEPRKDNGISIPQDVYLKIGQHIRNQHVIFGRNGDGTPRCFKWTHGLLQGDRFSSALCELYMSDLDRIHLHSLYQPHTFVHRTVDDYFFCSTEAKDVTEFLKTMKDVHILNEDKTESNLPEYGNAEISYCGQVFMTETKEVKGLWNFKKGTEIRHRYKLWNIARPIDYERKEQETVRIFLSRAMEFSLNTYHFKSMEMNTVFNTEATVLENYFCAMIALAFKLDVTVMAVHNLIVDYSVVTFAANEAVYKYAKKTLQLLNGRKGEHCTGLLTLPVFVKVGYQAFIVVLRKRPLYVKFQVVRCLTQTMRKVFVTRYKEISLYKFKTLPKCFTNIVLSRKMPHQKKHLKL